jgi:hypothetical protein
MNISLKFIIFIMFMGELSSQDNEDINFADDLKAAKSKYCESIFNNLKESNLSILYNIKYDSKKSQIYSRFGFGYLDFTDNILNQKKLKKEQTQDLLVLIKDNILNNKNVIYEGILLPTYTLKIYTNNILSFAFHLHRDANGELISVKYPNNEVDYFHCSVKLKNMLNRLLPQDKNDKLRYEIMIKKIESQDHNYFHNTFRELNKAVTTTEEKLSMLNKNLDLTRFVFYKKMENLKWREIWKTKSFMENTKVQP